MAMHDNVATFYGAYDQVGLHRLPRMRIPWVLVVLVLAIFVLIGLVVADVAAYDSGKVTVQVTSVSWYALGGLLTTSGGFSLHASQTVTLTLTCNSICFRLDGASVSSPFQMVSFAVTQQPVQYANVTVQAPTVSYDGPLSVTLSVG